MKIIIAGASGLIGSNLVNFLRSKGHTLKKLVRGKQILSNEEVLWDPSSGKLDPKDIEDCEAVINLAGENIAEGRWTESKKQRIRESRIASTQLLSQTLAVMPNPPKVFINASAIGFYGDRGEEVLTEDSANGNGFLAQVCQEWEAAAEATKAKGIRVVCVRTGMVLSNQGGALTKMLTPFKLGLGGNLGSGSQFVSWIDIDDLVRIFEFVLLHVEINGSVNATSPNPVRNNEFTNALGKALNRPTVFPIPVFAARVAFGQMADELLLASTKVEPSKLLTAGFQYQYPTIDVALKHTLES